MKLKYVFLMVSIAVIILIFLKKYDFGQRWRKESMIGLGSCGTDDKKELPAETTDTNDYSSSDNLPLREYCIKSSFNSCYNGTDVSKDTIAQRIQEGYRFLDLNVFPAENDVYVGFSPDNAPRVIQSKLLLTDALKEIGDKAFIRNPLSNINLTNFETLPMFVHIRVYRKAENSSVDIISKVATIINGVAGNAPSYSAKYLRDSTGAPEQIDGCTALSTLKGKIIFSMDILNILEIYAPEKHQSASNVPPDTITALQTFVNILSGGSTFPAYYRYTEGALSSSTVKLGISNESLKSSLQTNTKHLFIAFPHPNDVAKGGTNRDATGIVQPNIRSFILDHSIQFTPLRVYLDNEELKTYKNLFDDIGTPVAPMFFVYRGLNSAPNK